MNPRSSARRPSKCARQRAISASVKLSSDWPVVALAGFRTLSSELGKATINFFAIDRHGQSPVRILQPTSFPRLSKNRGFLFVEVSHQSAPEMLAMPPGKRTQAACPRTFTISACL